MGPLSSTQNNAKKHADSACTLSALCPRCDYFKCQLCPGPLSKVHLDEKVEIEGLLKPTATFHVHNSLTASKGTGYHGSGHLRNKFNMDIKS